ncbi:hypothetical protein [Rhodopseudomonas palustris]|uniref:hypothetical protein n=1 Tax=Rhodopseudomonas palustris TaxID=1076 RepID=UPI001F19B221|nr:hypothetical protein [Rhodopseudomonas palustris]
MKSVFRTPPLPDADDVVPPADAGAADALLALLLHGVMLWAAADDPMPEMLMAHLRSHRSTGLFDAIAQPDSKQPPCHPEPHGFSLFPNEPTMTRASRSAECRKLLPGAGRSLPHRRTAIATTPTKYKRTDRRALWSRTCIELSARVSCL